MSLATLMQKFKSGPTDLNGLVADIEGQMVALEIEATTARDAHVEALLHASDAETDANVEATRDAVAAVAQRIGY